MIHLGATSKVVPVRNTTQNAVSYFKDNNIKADLIYVDAGHFTDIVKADLDSYYPFLTGPRILCGDDYGWLNLTLADKGGPGAAIDAFA